MQTEEDPQENTAQVGAYITLPFVLAAPPILAGTIGRILDEWWGTDPYITYSMLILGFIAGVREFWRIVQRFKDK